ncbi:MAG TPA: hypothetical protein DFS52_01480 [Myxococcales bacterium]|nr:hypothetical protein [Myxococcales bacterium]
MSSSSVHISSCFDSYGHQQKLFGRPEHASARKARLQTRASARLVSLQDVAHGARAPFTGLIEAHDAMTYSPAEQQSRDEKRVDHEADPVSAQKSPPPR